jgi:DNA-binding protein Fis
VEHLQAALNKSGDSSFSPAQPFTDYVDELLAAAQREELSDAHARVLEMAERELFARAIQQAQGNQAKAARWLGVSRITMKAKLIQYGLHPKKDASTET